MTASLADIAPTAPSNPVRLFMANIHFTVRVSLRLMWNPMNTISVMHEELQHVPGPVACMFTRRGRIFIVKSGTVVASVTNNKKVFEKMKASNKTPIGRVVGRAITASGDHPHQWKLAKQILRPVVNSPVIDSNIPVVVESIALLAKASHGKPAGIRLYKETLKACTQSTFVALFETNLCDCIGDTPIDDFLRDMELVANTTQTAIQEVKEKQYGVFKSAIVTALAKSPEGTFGHQLQKIADDPDETLFTQEMANDNALFYVVALPIITSIVVHWMVLSLIRNPGHLERIRSGLDNFDRTYLMMCLKETLRLYPPVSAYMVRRSKVDTQLGNVDVPAKSLVMTLPVLLVKDQEFRPERWTDNFNLTDASYDDEAFYAPFSSGPRSCMGKYIVTNLLEDTMATLLSKHDFALVGKDPWKGVHTALQHFPDNGIGFKPAQDLMFKITPRGEFGCPSL